uniref:Uncharacterized protein n=1 Tax=viral metagenome TaxID=1070528 RepID=A0A6H1Z6N6_9ZZZZ
MKKQTVKYKVLAECENEWVERGGMFDKYYEARYYGDEMVKSGFIHSYEVHPVKAIWIKA